MAQVDLFELALEYAGRWVALNPDDLSVVASGGTAPEVFQQAVAAGIESPKILRVLEDYGALAP